MMLLGGSNAVYTSTDGGANITPITGPGANRVAMTYGASDNIDIVYVGSGSDVFVRTTAGGNLVSTGAPATSTVTDVLVDPTDSMTAYAVDADQVFQTVNGGTTWTDITGNLIDTDLRTIAFVPGTPDEIAVGGRSGVNHMRTDSVGNWGTLAAGLPEVLVFDLDYDPTDDLLVAGTLGRGAWVLQFTGPSPDPVIDANDIGGTGTDEGTPDEFRIVRNGADLEVYINGVLSDSFTFASLNSLTINGSGDDDTLIVDFGGGAPMQPPSGLFFNGGSGPSDTLRLENGTASDVTYRPTGPNDGTVGVDADTITFTGLEPVIDLVPSPFKTVVFPDGGNVVTLTDSAVPSDDRSLVDSPAFESYEFVTPGTSLTVRTGNGADTMTVTGPDALFTAGLLIEAMAGNDTVDAVGATVPLTIDGGLNDDDLRGSPRGNTIIGGPGADLLRGHDGRDHLDGGPGADTLLGGNQSDVLVGGAGADILYGHQGDDEIVGGDGDDEVRGGPGLDTIFGGAGDDDLRGGGSADTIYGGAGDDEIRGDSGADDLNGGADDDTILAGGGNDLLHGGPGVNHLDGGPGTDECTTTTSCEL
jgi:Ca2+-binding RTX toxin-like protein